MPAWQLAAKPLNHPNAAKLLTYRSATETGGGAQDQPRAQERSMRAISERLEGQMGKHSQQEGNIRWAPLIPAALCLRPGGEHSVAPPVTSGRRVVGFAEFLISAWKEVQVRSQEKGCQKRGQKSPRKGKDKRGAERTGKQEGR